MATTTTDRDGETLCIRGELDFDSVAELWNATESLFAAAPPSRIDLSGISRANSAGVALLVEWFGQAQRQGQALVFVNVPEQMRAIIAIADLDTVLPLA